MLYHTDERDLWKEWAVYDVGGARTNVSPPILRSLSFFILRSRRVSSLAPARRLAPLLLRCDRDPLTRAYIRLRRTPRRRQTRQPARGLVHTMAERRQREGLGGVHRYPCVFCLVFVRVKVGVGS